MFDAEGEGGFSVPWDDEMAALVNDERGSLHELHRGLDRGLDRDSQLCDGLEHVAVVGIRGGVEDLLHQQEVPIQVGEGYGEWYAARIAGGGRHFDKAGGATPLDGVVMLVISVDVDA